MPARQLRAGLHLTSTRPSSTVAARPPQPQRPARYSLSLPKVAIPWASTSTSALSNIFGGDALGARAMSLFQSALQPGTYASYNSNLAGFFSYCQEYNLAPLDTTAIDIARYVAWLGERGTVAADSLQPYLSAINRFLQDHARPPVALGPLVTGVRKGLAQCQVDTLPLPERVPLPAPVALAILELAEGLLTSVRWQPADPHLLLLRAAVATIASYIFFTRGECGATAHTEDLVVDSTSITLRLRYEKGKKALGTGRRNTRQIACRAVPRVAAVLTAFFAGVASMAHRRTRRWALSASEDSSPWSAATLSAWLQAAYTAAGCQPPAGFSWTSHSLRKGAASAAYAIKVPLSDIRFAGGWSTNSTVLEGRYVDFAMQPTGAAHLFFGHLLKECPP